MNARVLKVDSIDLSGRLIDGVIYLLMQGGIIGYPTETVYGLGGNAEDQDVITRICQLKGRDSQKAFLVLVANQEDVAHFVRNIPRVSKLLMNRFWPGPLTLIFDASPDLPRSLTGEKGKVGVRVSSDPVCVALLEKYRKPLVSTSANPAGKEPARSAPQVLEYFGRKIDLILDGGERRLGIPSTVLDISEESPRLLREGSIKKDEIENVIGEIK